MKCMKVTLNVVLMLVQMGLVSNVSAIGREGTKSVSDFTGDNLSFIKVSVASTTASALDAYSTSKGALTCINSDSTNAVYLGSSTAITPQGTYTFKLPAGAAIQFRSNAGVFAVAETLITSVVVYCFREW